MTRVKRVALAALASVMLVAASAQAQEAGQVGITMGYPASVGLVWHVTDKVALRPEVSFAFGSSETRSEIFETEGDSSTFGTGVAALFSLREWDTVRAYSGPRFSYGRTNSNSESILDDVTELTATTYEVTGLFGVQYTPHPRFAVFGEIGFAYSNRETKSDGTRLVLETQSWGTQTGAGIIFYFGR
jgi:hypothetical protein